MEYTIENAPIYPDKAVPFLKGVEDGFSVDLRTPLFEGRPREDVSDQWRKILLDHSDEMLEELVVLEDKQEAKIGTVSTRMPFADRRLDVESYYTSGALPSFGLSELRDIYDPFHHFPKHRLRPISNSNAASRLPQNTNSGLPYFSKRRDVLTESVALATSAEKFPAMLGWRGSSGQTGQFYPKQRVVWMFPYSWNIKEATFQQVILPYYVENKYFSALVSMEAVDERVTDILNGARSHGYVISTDYFHFDQWLVEQQSWFFEILLEMFQPSSEEAILSIQENLRTIPLLCTTNVQYEGEHGMPSGSTVTNLGESTVNIVIQTSSPVANPELFTVQGDDSVGIVDDPDQHLRHLEQCGFKINAEKQYVSGNSCVYLQRLHHIDYQRDGMCVGVYPTMRALNSLLGMERFHKNWDANMESLRTLSILENTRWHPLFILFVRFTVEHGDKYLKEFVMKLDKLPFRRKVVQQATSIPGFVPSYHAVDNLEGIASYKSVLAIRDL